MWHLKDEAEKLGIELGIEGDSVLPNLNNNALIGTTLSTLFRVLYVKDGPAGGEAAASSVKQLTTEQEAAYEVTTTGNCKILRRSLGMPAQPEQDPANPGAKLEDRESRRDIFQQLSKALDDNCVHPMPWKYATSWPRFLAWLQESRMGTRMTNGTAHHTLWHMADSVANRLEFNVHPDVVVNEMEASFLHLICDELSTNPDCPIKLKLAAWLTKTPNVKASMFIRLIEEACRSTGVTIAPFVFVPNVLPIITATSDQVEVQDFMHSLNPIISKMYEIIMGWAGQPMPAAPPAQADQPSSLTEIASLQAQIAAQAATNDALQLLKTKAEASRMSDLQMHSSTLSASADSKNDKNVRLGLANSQSDMDVLLGLESTRQVLEHCATMPDSDPLAKVKHATKNADVARMLTCEFSHAHAARNPLVSEMVSIRKTLFKFVREYIKNACPSFDPEVCNEYTELALRLDPDL